MQKDIENNVENDIDAASIALFHARQLGVRDWPVLSRACFRAGPWAAIDANHRYNGLLWNEQERARRLDLPPSEIAAGQRLIARYEQKRGDARDAIDAALLAQLAGVARQYGARLADETPGTIIDGLSTLALKIGRMRRHAQDQGAGADHACACHAALERLLVQRQEAMDRLDVLLRAARAGTASFKRWRQCRVEEQPVLHYG
jgi:hypothetical protein